MMFGVVVAAGFFHELAPNKKVMAKSKMALVLMFEWLNSFCTASKKITANFSNGCYGLG